MTVRIESEPGYRAVCDDCSWFGDLTDYVDATDDAEGHTCTPTNSEQDGHP